jgi:hypothetical protein
MVPWDNQRMVFCYLKDGIWKRLQGLMKMLVSWDRMTARKNGISRHGYWTGRKVYAINRDAIVNPGQET